MPAPLLGKRTVTFDTEIKWTPIRTGDVVWIQPGERHWHGATATTSMTHLATSIGQTGWQEEVAPGAARGQYPGETPGETPDT
jgi:quercetin dioxygenase-like cupin family protein